MKKKLIFVLGPVVILSILVSVFWKDVGGRLKAEGYIPYTVKEAKLLAFNKCSQCHNTDRIVKYCMRCGPPMIVVVHNMRELARLDRERGRKIEGYTDAQAVAIAQVWDALVGNWEDTWRKQDLVRLLKGDSALIKLLDTPVRDRPIERALKGEELPGAQKEMERPAGAPGPLKKDGINP